MKSEDWRLDFWASGRLAGNIEGESSLRRWWSPVVTHLCVCDESRSWIICAYLWRSRETTDSDPDIREYSSGMSCFQD